MSPWQAIIAAIEALTPAATALLTNHEHDALVEAKKAAVRMAIKAEADEKRKGLQP